MAFSVLFMRSGKGKRSSDFRFFMVGGHDARIVSGYETTRKRAENRGSLEKMEDFWRAWKGVGRGLEGLIRVGLGLAWWRPIGSRYQLSEFLKNI